MVTIRLARGGSNPVASGAEIRLSVNDERVQYWLSKGAQPSERVAALLKESQAAA